jgi:3-phosphoshikimate 1-carboxyvinyltransferase
VQGLGRDSLQGDVRFAQVLGQMGAEVEVHADSITVTGPDALDGIDINLNHMPDMAQTLAVVSLFARGGAAIRDVGNLRVKETDRLAALRNELTKLGAQVRIQGDDLFVQMDTPGDLRPASIDTYDDHRMAMSFAVAGLRSPGVVIHDPACVNKTFPEFWQYLLRLGAAEARTA